MQCHPKRNYPLLCSLISMDLEGCKFAWEGTDNVINKHSVIAYGCIAQIPREVRAIHFPTLNNCNTNFRCQFFPMLSSISIASVGPVEDY